MISALLLLSASAAAFVVALRMISRRQRVTKALERALNATPKPYAYPMTDEEREELTNARWD